MNPPHQNYQTPTTSGDQQLNPQFPKQIPPIQQNIDQQRQMNQQQNIAIKPAGQTPQGQPLQKQGQQSQQGSQKPIYANLKAFLLIHQAQQFCAIGKAEAQKQQKQNSDARLKENLKKWILNNEKGLRSNKDYLEEQKKLFSIPHQELQNQIIHMTRMHTDKKNETDQNIQKNMELLNFLKNYKSNNPQSNFQDRENNQQIVNNYQKDDSFELMVEESSKEVKMNQQQQQEYAQMQMEQPGYDQNQYAYDDGQNNQLLDGNQINQYDENGMQDDGYAEYN